MRKLEIILSEEQYQQFKKKFMTSGIREKTVKYIELI